MPEGVPPRRLFLFSADADVGSRQGRRATKGSRETGDIFRLGSTLESAMTEALETAERPSALVEMTVGSAEFSFSAMDRLGTTSGGDQ